MMILIILKIINGRKNSGGTTSSATEKDEELENRMEKLQDKLQDVQMETAIEISAAKTKNEEVIKKLEEIKKIEDKTERRKQLAAMIG